MTQQDRAVINLVINGQQAQTSLKEITLSTARLRSEIIKMKEADNPELYRAKVAEYQKMVAAQKQMATQINNTTTAWQKFGQRFAEVSAGVLGGNLMTMGFQQMLGLIPAVTQRGMELKDQLADIAKTADMTDLEVAGLNKELRGLNTRTATKDLRELAAVGGQFGIAKDQMADFVAGADKINVALGDQFGGAEQTVTQMMTLRNTLQDIKTDRSDQDMLHIANSINVLEAAGAATAPVIADFTSRIGGVAIPLGLTSAQTLGLSAALQEMNVTAERGSTAVIDILNGMAKAPAEFARYAIGADGAKLSSKQFADLVNNDLMGALLSVARGFNTGDTSATGMAKKMDQMGLSGTGVMEIFMKLATNTDMVEQKIALAGSSIDQTSSITGEFSKRNYALAVNMKKLGEFVSNLLTSDTLLGLGSALTDIAVRMLGLKSETEDTIHAFEEQKNKVQNLNTQIGPLLSRIDELKSKTNLSKTEQDELRKAVDKVAQVMPIAASGFDQYGRAMDINTEKARKFMEQQQYMAEYLNRDAIKAQENELAQLEKQRAARVKDLNKGEVTEKAGPGGGGIAGSQAQITRKMTNEELSAIQQETTELNAEIEKRKEILKGLKGYSLDVRREMRRARLGEDVPKMPAGIPPSKTGTGTATEIDPTKEEKERLKAKEDAEEAIRELSAKAQADEKTRELERVKANYEKERKKANDAKISAELRKTWLANIAGAEKVELKQIEEKYDKQERDRQQKKIEQLLKDADEELQIKKRVALADVKADQAAGKITDEEAKAAQLVVEQTYLEARRLLYTAHYETLQELAKTDAERLEEIARQKKERLAEIDTAIQENETSQQQAKSEIVEAETKTRSEQEQKEEKNRADALKAHMDRRRDIFNDSVMVLKGFFKENTKVYRAALIAQQAWALAETGIEYGRALMKSVAAAAGIPFPANLLAIAKSAAVPTLSFAGAVARIRAQKFDAPQFIDGGFTRDTTGMPGGFYSTPTFFSGKNYSVSEDGRPEFVINNRALQVPAVANFARMLDVVQRSGNYSAVGNSSPSGSGNEALLAEIRAMRQDMQQSAQRPVYAKIHYQAWEDETGRISDIRNQTSL
ncbi:phage tail tape measure protein [Arsenicibacter rosenii]|nr:phage tail tape measure protein [Arsenicibacter rosenii]